MEDVPEEDRIYAFLKFSEKPYIEELYNDGKMHFSLLSSFNTKEMGTLQGDPNESLSEIYPAKGDFKVIIGGVDISSSIVGSPIISGYDDSENNFIWCSYGIFEKQYGSLKNNEKLDFSKMKELGNYCIIVLNFKEFNKRLEDAFYLEFSKNILKNWINKTFITGGAVEYVPNDYTGYFGPFKKYLDYEIQNEYRYVLNRIIGVPNCVECTNDKKLVQIDDEIYLAINRDFYDMYLGNLSDISVIVPVDEVNDALIMYFSEGKSISEIQKKYPI
ncbi:hypothetical protein [Methanococcus maripaludis]|uniref:Uncharacterized protein n=2 Tax=Methanococcus maripaludis TaxID=39152 RepID=A0A7J9PJQ7_METMI|nr:hypothetical protein [Methanococcus maripaludis]MBA2862897.1 hypothetical protein [Methanococcus maripaludis]